jgi:2-amino-4-hydroxy-6-hydroxymethyldihydropteridine diphosphokinase
MNLAYLITGGNLGDRVANLETSIRHLEINAGRLLQASAIYQTAAWGMEDQPDFLNQVLLLQTSLAPTDLLQSMLQIERQMGRIREAKYGPRTIDIDLLLYNQVVMNEPHLTLPHPRFHLRRFALQPLADLAPSLLHPVLHQTIGHLLLHCADPLNVKKYSGA